MITGFEWFLYFIIFLNFAFIIFFGITFYKDKSKKVFFWRQQALSSGDLEEMYATLYKNINILSERIESLSGSHSKTRQTLSLGVVKLGLVKYNYSKQDMGGNLSFSLALIDESNKGVVITSLHGRESSRVYCKDYDGVSEGIMTTEELSAIDSAKKYFKII